MAKKKRTSGLTGEEKQARRRERLEARREAKAEAEARRMRAQRRERLVRMSMFVLIIFGVVWFLFLRNQAPSEINGNEIETLSAAGVGQHTSGTVNYESSPPVSGQHAGASPACGTYGQSIPNESQVHMLEHGAVGVQYQPNLAPEEIEQVEDIVSSFDSHVFSAPYENMENPIAVSSWSRLMRLDEVEGGTIREYIEEFRKKGPESGRPCDMDVDESFEPAPEESPPGAEEETNGNGGGGGGG
jgi:hypothetical protein